MKLDQFAEALVKRGILDKIDAQDILSDPSLSGKSISEVLKEKGVDASSLSLDSVSDVPVKILSPDYKVPYDVLNLIPEETARTYGFVPLSKSDNILQIGMIDPADFDALDALNFIARKIGAPYKIFWIRQSDFEKILEMYKSLTGEVGEALHELETELGEEEKKIQQAIDEQEKEGGDYIKEDAPVIKIVATILRYAIEGRASDIHIERVERYVKVRFRVDGVLHTSLTLPPKIHSAIVARIKVLASLRLDEKRKPQDGRFSAAISGRKIDFRVSTFPTYFGEKIVMRILDRERGFISMENLGLSDYNLKLLRSAIKKPHGLILISGPTGSGKSTTLYSVLSELDRETKNILTLEDPVEYYIDGINQSQIRPEIGYTFANALRTAMRQDPDIIMVGEIRDVETAKLAIQAALTGHLVLSTIHTNSAVGVIPRLVDMGVDPYLIAPTLILAIAQRLTRKLCPNSYEEIPLDESEKELLRKEFEDLPPEFRPAIPNTIVEAKPSKECPSGTRGRLAVFEFLPVDKEIQHIILNGADEERIYSAARRKGMLTMKEDAYIKVFNKQIPMSEAQKLNSQLLAEGAFEIEK